MTVARHTDIRKDLIPTVSAIHYAEVAPSLRRRVAIGTKGARVLVNNMTMLRNLLRLGQGIGLMDEVMGAADVNDGVLCRVLPEWSLPPVAVPILMPSRLLPAKARAFSECLARQLSEFN